MSAKAPKVYTIAQVVKLLGFTRNTIYNYINAGLIKVIPRDPGKREGGQTVTEDEYQRLKRDGVNPVGIKAKLAKRSASGTQSKRSATAAAKKRVKRKAAAAVAKKQVKRAAPAASKTAAKKRAKK